MLRRSPVVLLAIWALAVAPEGRAQTIAWREVPRVQLSGLGVQAGVADPDEASPGFAFGGTLGLGTILHPRIDLSAEAGFWRAVEVTKQKLPGDLRNVSVGAHLSYDIVRVHRIVPHVSTGVSAHLLRADIPSDRQLEEALEGFGVGLDLGGGVAFHADNGWRFGAESRWALASNAGHWSIMARTGWFPHSRRGGALRADLPVVVAGLPAPAVRSLAPAAEPSSSAASDTEIVLLQDLVQRLLKENRNLQAEVETLRAAGRPVRASAGAMAPESAAIADAQRSALRHALEEVAGLSGQMDALRETQDGLLLSMHSSLLFGIGSSQLQLGAIEELRRVAAVLVRFPDLDLVIEGHTDSYGDARFNQQLSEQRAAAVQRELVRVGVSPDRIRVLGFGSERPVADNATSESRARNRRVEIRMLQPGTVAP